MMSFLQISPTWRFALDQSVAAIAPELFLTLLLVAVLVIDVVKPKSTQLVGGYVSLGGLLALLGWLLFSEPPVRTLVLFEGMVSVDQFTWYGRILLTLAHILTLIQALVYFRQQTRRTGEFFVLLLGLHLGLVFMSMAQHLMLAFLAIELASVCGYVLTAWLRTDKASAEAAVKYMLYGIFSSAIMLFGMSLLYGLTGTLQFSELGLALAQQPLAPALVALLLTLGGLAYKAGLVPFHFWVPDVYQASSYPVAAALAGAGKVGAFMLFLQWFMHFPAAGLWDGTWLHVVIALAIVSMVWGNLAAWGQTHYRRLLAYSSIGHGGVMLLAAAVGGAQLQASLGYYLLVYVILTYGALMAGQALLPYGEQMRGWMGTARGYLGVVLALAVLLPALAGLPPTAGFTAKLVLFVPLWDAYAQQADGWVLAGLIVAILTTLLGIYYYLKPLIYLIVRKPTDTLAVVPGPPRALVWGALLLAAAALLFGLYGYDQLVGALLPR